MAGHMHCRGAARSCASTFLFQLLLLKADRINPLAGTSWSWWGWAWEAKERQGKPSPLSRGHRSYGMCRCRRLPLLSAALYCVREIICCVWLPSLASAQPEYVCLQSWAVSWLGCSWFVLFTFPDTHYGLGPGIRARGGMTARQARTLPASLSAIDRLKARFCCSSSLQAAGFWSRALLFSKGEVSSLAVAALRDGSAR